MLISELNQWIVPILIILIIESRLISFIIVTDWTMYMCDILDMMDAELGQNCKGFRCLFYGKGSRLLPLMDKAHLQEAREDYFELHEYHPHFCIPRNWCFIWAQTCIPICKLKDALPLVSDWLINNKVHYTNLAKYCFTLHSGFQSKDEWHATTGHLTSGRCSM